MTRAWQESLTSGVPSWSLSDDAGGAGAPEILTTSLADPDPGIPYEATVTVTGPGTVTLAVDSGALPTWATLTDFTIAGSFPVPGYDEFTLIAESEYGSDTQALSITVPNEMSGGGEIDVEVTLPAAPTATGATSVLSTTATAAWTDGSTNETFFEVQYAPGPAFSSWVNAPTFPTTANATSTPLTGLTSDTQYKYRVRAGNTAGYSAWSVSDAFTTLVVAPLVPDTGVYQLSGAAVPFNYREGPVTYVLTPETGTFTLAGADVPFAVGDAPSPGWRVVVVVQSPNWRNITT